MTLTPQKKEQLAAFLASLPSGAALKLFAGLEADRAKGGKDLPHDLLLDDLRAQLLARGETFPQRRYDAKRLFFTPFEDFLTGTGATGRQRASIARSSINPIWRLMMSEPLLSDAALAAASLDDAIARGEAAEPLAHALFLSAEADLGRLCESVKSNPDMRERALSVLGNNETLDDLMVLKRLLPGVEIFKQLHQLVPTGAPTLSEEQLYELRSLFLAAIEQYEDLGAYLLLALKGRLEKPWRALSFYYHLARSADERLRKSKDTASILPESLFEDFENIARALERDGAGALDARAARLRVSYFADYADGLARQAKKIGDNVFLNRVEACRDVAGEAFDRFTEQALASLRALTPVCQGGSSKLMSQRPDYSHPLSPSVVDDAIDAAVLIAEAPALSARLGADPDFAGSIADDARDNLHVYAKDLITEIRAVDGADRKAAQRRLEHVLKAAAPLLDSDVIGLLRDRAAVAAVSV